MPDPDELVQFVPSNWLSWTVTWIRLIDRDDVLGIAALAFVVADQAAGNVVELDEVGDVGPGPRRGPAGDVAVARVDDRDVRRVQRVDALGDVSGSRRP
jgi:hypothetical protein